MTSDQEYELRQVLRTIEDLYYKDRDESKRLAKQLKVQCIAKYGFDDDIRRNFESILSFYYSDL